MEEEIITYQDRKEDVYGLMMAQNPDVNPISYGSGYVFSELWDVNDIMLCEYSIACGLFELERNDLEPRIEEQMTYWIYQVKQGLFDDEIPDIDIMKADIEKIESMIHLKFEDLECYEVDK
jgi:hypothetical protein